MTKDHIYMRRALQLAGYGAGHVSPNPMVGCVIVSADDRVIGEGWHRRYGGPHAEVNAVASILPDDRHLLNESTVYVTLEPCSHYGKTPPCAKMLCELKPARVVVGTGDPNPKVSGRGIKMLREAGIKVDEDCLRDECRQLNVRFFTAHTLHRPWIILKWAENEAGQMNAPDGKPIVISSPLTSTLMHAQRAMTDAILVGTNTLLTDNPSLDTRLWPGNSPRPVIFDSKRLHDDSVKEKLKVMKRDPIILNPETDLPENMHILFREYGITSLMVEGGKTLLDSFLKQNLYECIRVEKRYIIM